MMIDKGVPIPPELLRPSARESRSGIVARNDLRGGIIMVGVGLGLLFAHLRLPGFIVLFIGVALLVVWKLAPKPEPDQQQIPPGQ